MQEKLFISIPVNSKPGIMLSGGADSSLLLWFLTHQNVHLKTFTIDESRVNLIII